MVKVFGLKIKFTLITLSIGLISFGTAAFLASRWTAKEFEEHYQERATLVWTHIIHDLESSMLQEMHGEILRTLDLYRTSQGVEEVRIFNSKGEEAFVKQQGPRDPGVEEALRSAKPVHVEIQRDENQIAKYIIPIQNKPECRSCHGKDMPLRGALVLSLSMKEMEADIGQLKKRFFILFAL